MGKHLSIDLIGAQGLDDLKRVESSLRACLIALGAAQGHVYVHTLTPKQGVTGVAILDHTRISVHTWPESGYAAFDLLVATAADPQVCVEVLRKAFKARDVRVRVEQRGDGIALLTVAPKAPVKLRAVRKARAA